MRERCCADVAQYIIFLTNAQLRYKNLPRVIHVVSPEPPVL
jgi:hypothetical protein